MEPGEILLQSPGYVGWKNNHLYYLGCNHNLAVSFGLKAPEEIIGLNDNQLLYQRQESLALHTENDMLVLTGKTIKCVHVISDKDIFYFEKKPLIDKDNIVNGIIFCCHQFTSLQIKHFVKLDKKYFCERNNPNHYHLDPPKNPYQFSSRELECLFYLLRGKSAKETSLLLQLSKRTVEFYIENIKNKMGYTKKSDIISKAITAGYIYFIPPRLLHTV